MDKGMDIDERLSGMEPIRVDSTAEWICRAGDGEAAPKVIEGYAIRYDEAQRIGRRETGWEERIARGSMDTSGGVKCVVNHDPNQLLGSTEGGNLTVEDRGDGLWMRCELDPDDPMAMRVARWIERGHVTGQSFLAIAKAGKWEDRDSPDGWDRLTITRARMLELGPNTFPQYKTTSAVTRGVVDALRADRHAKRQAGVERIRALSRLQDRIKGIDAGGSNG